jgi:hypothetical protein
MISSCTTKHTACKHAASASFPPPPSLLQRPPVPALLSYHGCTKKQHTNQTLIHALTQPALTKPALNYSRADLCYRESTSATERAPPGAPGGVSTNNSSEVPLGEEEAATPSEGPGARGLSPACAAASTAAAPPRCTKRPRAEVSSASRASSLNVSMPDIVTLTQLTIKGTANSPDLHR